MATQVVNPNTQMGASGPNHAPGTVPDPGATAGTSKFLREDATFQLTVQTIASGAVALGTSSIPAGSAASVISVAATGVLSTDNLLADFNSDPTIITGYIPSTSGGLTIVKYCTPGFVNFTVVNFTNGSITPGAVTLNWRVFR
jgi:hypothetical protein